MTKRQRNRRSRTPAERFDAWIANGKLVESDSGCWLWTGALSTGGYAGRIKLVDFSASPHRWSYEVHRAPIPAGLDIDHLCRVRHCLNPWHMEPVTRAVNIQRAIGIGVQWSSRTACSQGHEYKPETTYVNPQGHRACRICVREWRRAKKESRYTPKRRESVAA